jgi:hypothetical protein
MNNNLEALSIYETCCATMKPNNEIGTTGLCLEIVKNMTISL